MKITKAQIEQLAIDLMKQDAEADETGSSFQPLEGWIKAVEKMAADETRPFFLERGGLADVMGGIGSQFTMIVI